MRRACRGPADAAALDTVAGVSSALLAGSPATSTGPAAPARAVRSRCLWCGRELPAAQGIGRRRRYCAQSCRQRAYENRNALERGSLPPDAVVLSGLERDDLADRLYQVRCAAEDVATALGESADRGELLDLVDQLLAAARSAERIR